MPAGMPKAYYEIVDNLKAEYEKTGKIRGKKYTYWDSGASSGDACHRAHTIAVQILKSREKRKYTSNQEILKDLDYYLKKSRELESFNHPDWKHVHSEGYDPDK